MLFTVLTLLSIVAFQTIQTSMSPATLKAMATIQAQKARAVANANTLRARALYNAALARSNLGLLDHRIVRDSGTHIPDYNDENDDILPDDYNDYLDMNIPEEEEDARTASHPKLKGGIGLQHLLGLDEELLGMKHEEDVLNAACACNNLNEHPDALGIPEEMNDFEENTNHESKQRRSDTLSRSVGHQNHLGSSHDSTLGMQPTFQQAFAAIQPQYGQQMLVPLQFMPQSMSAMQLVPQGATFSNIPVQTMTSPQTGFAPQMIFLRQSPAQDKMKLSSTQEPSLLESDGSNIVGDPHLGTFSHTYTHTHSHSHLPQQNIQVPNTQIVTPNVNVHVNQNQNSVVPSQQIPLQPTFSTGGGKLITVNPGGSVYSQIPPPTFPIPGGGIHGVTRPTMSASQSQSIQTNTFNTPVVGGNSFSQSQNIYQGGRVGEPIVGMEAKPMDLDQIDPELEKVGTFLTDFRMRAPESPEDFDPDRPVNLQPVVNYIERQSGNMERMVQSIENNEHSPLDSESKYEYVGSPHQTEDQEMDDERLGTIPMDNIKIDPLPTLPEDFGDLSPDQQREAIDKLLHQEQDNAKRFLERVNESNLHNFEMLSNLINLGPEFNPEHDIIGSTQFNGEPDAIKLKESELEIQNMNARLSDDNFNLGHIIDIPENRESEWYLRSARSSNKTNTDKLDKLLLAEKEVVEELKKDAKHDEDLMMTDYLAENVIDHLEEKKNETKRVRREIGRSFSLPLNRFIHDPRTRLDIPKTIDNIGAVAKNAFDYEKAPLYHVRNLVGSAQDAVLATMKIPTKNLLIPSSYDIVKRNEDDAVLGGINPIVFTDKYTQPGDSLDNIAGTFHKVGSAIRGGVLSGQEALSHVGQVANHAKNAIHSTRYIAPRLRMQQIPAITREPRKKAVLITPRIFDVTSEKEQVERVSDHSPEDFVRVGQILDAIGVSNPNNNEVKFEKIIVEPQNTISIFRASDQSKPSKMFNNLLGNVRVEDFKAEEEEQLVGDTLSNLEKVKESFNVENIKEFLAKVKQNMQGLMSNIHPGNLIPHQEHPEQESKPTQNQAQNPEKVGDIQNQEIVEATMIPDNLLHPFMGYFSESELDKIWNEENPENLNNHSETDKRLGQILGAINPMMLEKIFNESVKTEDGPDTPFTMFHHDHDGHSHGAHENENEEVGTSMKLTQVMMKPFMGQANSKMTSDFIHKYTPDFGESKREGNELKGTTETPQWIQVVNDGNDLVYGE